MLNCTPDNHLLVPGMRAFARSILLHMAWTRHPLLFSQAGTISDSVFTNNTATDGQGGGVYLETVICDVVNSRWVSGSCNDLTCCLVSQLLLT